MGLRVGGSTVGLGVGSLAGDVVGGVEGWTISVGWVVYDGTDVGVTVAVGEGGGSVGA